jgi:thioredoxin-related protein
MTHRLIAFILVCGWSALFALGVARGEDVQWRKSYAEARAEAAAKDKLLLLAFGSDDCHWCKRLETETLRDPAVQAQLKEQFVTYKVDSRRDARLTTALNIQSYPTLIFAAPDGKVLGVQEGYVDVARFQEQLRRATALNRPAAPEIVDEPRVRKARELLAHAREDCRARRFLTCLDQCERIAIDFADLTEGSDAVRLAAEIKNNPEWMRQACDQLEERLALQLLTLAEAHLRKGQPSQAVACLERVMQVFPGTRQAEAAQARLRQIQTGPSAVESKKP